MRKIGVAGQHCGLETGFEVRSAARLIFCGLCHRAETPGFAKDLLPGMIALADLCHARTSREPDLFQMRKAAMNSCMDPLNRTAETGRVVAQWPRLWVWVLCLVCWAAWAVEAGDFKVELFGGSARIFANIVTQDVGTGYVQINGGAADLATQPVWDFGDGTVLGSWFPVEHTYLLPRSNYIVRVTGRFTDGATNSTELLVRFAPPAIKPVTLPKELLVTVPPGGVSLVSRMPGYGFSPDLSFFDDGFFTTNLPRDMVEYILTAAAALQWEFVNSNVFLVDGGFRQVVLRDPNFGGMYSIWYSSPVAFGSGDYGFQGTPQYSSFFHEMGHNFTLNFPAGHYYGGKIDGNANAIYSETLAQIFQHATAYEIMNRAAELGLSGDLVFDIRQSASSSISLVRAAYEHYLESGTNFFSWNDPATPDDETFDTFMAIAYKFLAHAETAGQGYAMPTRRLMRLLGVFDENLQQQYDAQNNTAAADRFRATLLVAGLSHAFQLDLREEFRGLRFPVDDDLYGKLMSRVGLEPPLLRITYCDQLSTIRVSWPSSSAGWELQQNTEGLDSANWSNVLGNILDDGFNRTISLTPTSSRAFYRLRKP